MWFVTNDDGDLIGHDMTETEAKLLADSMRQEEPNAGWEALNDDEE